MRNPSDLTIINYFLETLSSEAGLAKNTILSYQNDLKLFSSFLLLENPNYDGARLLACDEKIIKSYLQKLYQDGISAASAARKISTLKSFFKFLEIDNYIKQSPIIDISAPKKRDKLPKLLSEKEIFILLETVNSDRSEFGIRLSCMLEILYASGLRVSELVNLPFSAIEKTIDENGNNNFKNYLLVNGKGNKERIAPLNKSALKILGEYIKLREDLEQSGSKWLFCGHFRSSKKSIKKHLKHKLIAIDRPITRQRMHQMLKELARKAGIDPKRVSPHIIRHSFASHLLNNGIDLRILQELLGHSDISTTQIYTHILDSKLKELVYNHHPLAKGN